MCTKTDSQKQIAKGRCSGIAALVMKLTQLQNEIRLDFKYDPNLVSIIGSIPGASFCRDPLGVYWTIPYNELPYLFRILDLTPGSLYPDCVSFIRPGFFNGLSAEIKHDRVKLQGQKIDWMIRSLNHVCEVEFSQKDMMITREVLGSLIFSKPNLAVYQFPPGLYWRVSDFLKLCGVNLKIHPYPHRPHLNPLDINVSARPYQEEATDGIISGKIPNRAILVMSTGAGKTILSVMITAALGLNTIFYTYSSDLLRQTATVYEDILGCEIGRIGDKQFNIKPITIATIQTVYSCLTKQDSRWEELSAFLNTVDLAFIDEGHMLGAETVFSVAKATDAYYMYALTATPFREDGKELFIEAATGPAVELVAEEKLIADGYILPVHVEVIPVRHQRYQGKRFSTQYKNHIVRNTRRNETICDIARSFSGRKTLILVKEIKHGEILAEMLQAPFLHSTSSARGEILDRFAKSDIDLLIASPILKQGVDLPEAEILILAHGGVSQVELLQKIGRVRRPAAGKTAGIVIDFYDFCPEATTDVFRQQSEKRLAFYRSRNFSILDKPSSGRIVV